ncbi:hypothetical protein B0H12DRAFT_167140 [Mycena haematopus]|nr:hypothetical protein B0H12DRAFT_167140 [Mycena haematopus]
MQCSDTSKQLGIAHGIPTITVEMVPEQTETLRHRDGELELLRQYRQCADTLQAICDRRMKSTISLPHFERINSLWFDDGNLIIQAGTHLFRIFRGMLVKHSLVFEELLSSQNLSTYEVFDGCPILVVPQDGIAVGHFLAAIYNPNSFDQLISRIEFDAIAAVFCLSTIYQIPGLPRKALTLLSSAYPTSLAEFVDVGFGPSYCRDHILPVIQFAREHSIDCILPLAFYRYCLEMTGDTQAYGVEYGGVRVVLGLADQKRCYDAHSAMCAANKAAVLDGYATRVSDVGCTGGTECQTSRLHEGAKLLPRLGSLPDILLSWAPQADSQLCSGCLKKMQQWDLHLRQSFWDDLPCLFDLPDWAVLNQLKSATLGEAEDEEEITF